MQKQRHGCLTVWLVFVIVVNSLVGLLYLFAGSAVASTFASPKGWAIPVLVIVSAANVGFATALFLWKKWGFYGFVATSVLTLAVNLAIGLNPVAAVFGLVGVAILYGILHIGNESNRGWPQLE
jgi:hypothetical protein